MFLVEQAHWFYEVRSPLVQAQVQLRAPMSHSPST